MTASYRSCICMWFKGKTQSYLLLTTITTKIQDKMCTLNWDTINLIKRNNPQKQWWRISWNSHFKKCNHYTQNSNNNSRSWVIYIWHIHFASCLHLKIEKTNNKHALVLQSVEEVKHMHNMEDSAFGLFHHGALCVDALQTCDSQERSKHAGWSPLTVQPTSAWRWSNIAIILWECGQAVDDEGCLRCVCVLSECLEMYMLAFHS